MIGSKLTVTATGLDLKRENGTVVKVADGTQAAQHGASRLWQYRNESVSEDENADYTKWYSIVFNMNKTQTEKEFEIKRRILGTPGVLRITYFNWKQEGRHVTITATVQTLWGEAEIGQEITLL